MIALLRGTLIEKHPNQAILDVGGVGLRRHDPDFDFLEAAGGGRQGRSADPHACPGGALALYGFLTQDEKRLFEKLIGVSGIGPGLAVKVSAACPRPICSTSIRRGEIERLVRIPGVGKKTAERMVLELRDKLPAPPERSTGATRALPFPLEEDVLSALLEPGLRAARGGGGDAQGAVAAERPKNSSRCFARRWSWQGERPGFE